MTNEILKVIEQMLLQTQFCIPMRANGFVILHANNMHDQHFQPCWTQVPLTATTRSPD